MPSFIANRVYILDQGIDYDARTNGNLAIKFRGKITAGSADIELVDFKGTNPITRIDALILAGAPSVPVISGPGYVGRNVITGTAAPAPPLNYIITCTNAFTATGTFDFWAYDESVPSDLDSPILALHVIAAPGAVISFTTLTGDAVTVPSGGFATGGIYDYSPATFSALPATKLLGLAPANKSLTL